MTTTIENSNTTSTITTPSKGETLAERQERVEALCADIIAIVDNEEGSALRGIHMVNVAGSATRGTYKAIERRIVADQDPYGAYHLALMAQNTSNLPVDARQLIEMVINLGDNDQLFSLLKNLPLPPVEVIQAKVTASGDEEAIAKINAYLKDNPEGYGSEITLGNSQKDRIIPLSEDK